MRETRGERIKGLGSLVEVDQLTTSIYPTIVELWYLVRKNSKTKTGQAQNATAVAALPSTSISVSLTQIFLLNLHLKPKNIAHGEVLYRRKKPNSWLVVDIQGNKNVWKNSYNPKMNDLVHLKRGVLSIFFIGLDNNINSFLTGSILICKYLFVVWWVQKFVKQLLYNCVLYGWLFWSHGTLDPDPILFLFSLLLTAVDGIDCVQAEPHVFSLSL